MASIIQQLRSIAVAVFGRYLGFSILSTFADYRKQSHEWREIYFKRILQKKKLKSNLFCIVCSE